MSTSPQAARWKAATIKPTARAEAGRIVDRIMANKARYVAVDNAVRVPWYVIAGLHNMESGGSFKHHLHEGSPLTGRTRYIPRGRPIAPPANGKAYTWEESAIDALRYDKLDKADWRSLQVTLEECEDYNGEGYQGYHPEVPTPYLWAGTSIERPGKYIADGRWSPTAISKQIGIATIWKLMEERGILNFSKLRP